MTMTSASFFNDVETLPADALFGINALCQADENKDKINLTLGAYRDDEGNPFVLESVKEAQGRLMDDEGLNHEYLPLGGLSSFNHLSAQLVLGASSPALAPSSFASSSSSVPSVPRLHVHSIQSLGGTGALRLAAEFLRRSLPSTTVHLPASTWPTHLNILRHAGVAFDTYRYLTAPPALALDFSGLLADLSQCPRGSIVLLHMVAHNPSGFDPSQEQWRRILRVVQDRGLLPLFDNAYQGFYRGLEEDAFPVRLFASAGVEMLVACSYSKNFGLYGERVGCLHVLSRDSSGAAILSQLRALSRSLHSNCPSFGVRVVATILEDPVLRDLWENECALMAARLNDVRARLHALLLAHKTPGKWDHVLEQGGMFSLTGIPPAAIARLQTQHHVYMLSTGRISLAGLNSANIERFVSAVTEAILFTRQHKK